MQCATHPNMLAQNQAQSESEAHGGDAMVLTPSADIHEDAGNIVVLADLPGVPLADVNISLEQNLLTISGKQSAANSDGYTLTYAEFEACKFHRVFRVETSIDREKITASMQNGVLRITLPKTAPAKTKIDVAAS